MIERARIADWTSLPLGAGERSLIEASAGTGKTWTISALYLRLILEALADAPLTPRRIVVATFTDAAADELRQRIRERLLRAVVLAENPEAARSTPDNLDDADAWLVARWDVDSASRARDLLRLRLALGELDLAPIGTLHGLCGRVLRDYPFESGAAFARSELIAGDELLDELADDLWRQLQQGAASAPPFDSVQTRDKLRERLKWCLMPGVALWAPTAQQLDADMPATWAPRIAALADDKSLWGRQTKAPRALRGLAAWLSDRNAPWTSEDAKAVDEATTHLVASSRDRVETTFLAANQRLLQYAADAAEIREWQQWAAQARARRDATLAASDRLTFDDLLTRVRDALVREDGKLAERLFAEWPIALVDEFQDTDAVQYAVLDRIYRDAAGAPRGRLVMIGDPKQAIYRFRGGDIDTHLRAARAAQTQLKLTRNFRSTQAYVDALNEWFARAGNALSAAVDADAIRVDEVLASDIATDRADAPALTIHYRAEAPAGSADRIEAALVACAEQIVALLNDAQDRAPPGDIAVLVPAHRHVQQLRALLTARRVPCVGAGRGSVFETDWARELQIVLHAVEHGDEGARRAALATRLGGLGFAELVALRDQPAEAERHARDFTALKQQWQDEGVLAVVLELAQRAARRIAGMAERERALTDLRHLGEMLEEREQHLHGAEQLLAWLAAQRGRSMDEADANDERLLRIESDAKRVRLMTLHMSKGLEFPIVMLPLMWQHEQRRTGETAVIEEALCGERVLGFGSAAKRQFAREGQDERFRVLYVALTRAKKACHLFAYSPRRLPQANSKAPLGDPQRSALDAMLDHLLDGAAAPRPALRHIAWRTEAWAEGETLYQLPAASAATRPVVLPLPPVPLREDLWSFSALTRTRQARDDEAAAEDEGEIIAEPGIDPRIDAPVVVHDPDPELLTLSALRGTEFGNAVHQMFETRRVGTPFAAQHGLIDRALREHGVALRDLAHETAIERIALRLDAALAAEIAPGLRLGKLPAQRLRPEMEFRFALDAVSLHRLRDVCAAHGEPALLPQHVSATTLRGLMVGMIDLVIEQDGRFHVLDYKSNHLGDTLADYAPAALGAAMDAHHYRLQALLYSVALDRYLRTRVADYRRARHLGEAIYLFVRAVGIGPELGVWRARFGDALIEAVDGVFAGAREAA
jgi:exodeoxyribonuclease V beta subunit